MSYTLEVKIASDSIEALKASNYNLCVAKAVNGKFNVVWSGNRKYLNGNTFQFQDKFQVFGSGAFQDGALVDSTIDPVSILEGQRVTLSKAGTFGSVSGTPTSGRPIHIVNQYGSINFGVKVLSTEGYSEIFSSEQPYVSGTVDLSPKRSLMVWFDQNIKTKTMFSHAMSNTVTVDYPAGTNHIILSYVANPEDPGSGTWSFGNTPLLGRTYDPETNTFKLDEALLPKADLIKVWNAKVEEGLEWGHESWT